MIDVEKALIIIMAHKPAGVWKETWYSITWFPGKAHACSVPFGDAKEISKQIDDVKAKLSKGRLVSPKFVIEWHKESTDLTFRNEDEDGEVDWRELFNVKDKSP